MLETYADVLLKAFSDHGLQPCDATNRDERYKVLRVKGMFSCANKHGQSNPWSSHHAWLTVDLHKLKVSRRWEQKCKVCKTSRAPFVLKTDFEQAVRKMMLSVLEQRLGISCKVDKALLASNEPDKQHVTGLCEKCRWGMCNCTGRGANPEGGARPESDSLSLELGSMSMWRSKWADPMGPIQQHLPTRAQRESNAIVFNGVMRALRDYDANMYVDFLEGGSRGKGTDLDCSDLDIVVFVSNFQPNRQAVRCSLQAVATILTASDHLELAARIDVHARSLGFKCVGVNGHRVACDLLLGGRDDEGERRNDPIVLTTMPANVANLSSPSFNHLQTRYFKGGRTQFRSLCRMAKLWVRDGTSLEQCSGASYTLELIMLQAWLEASQHERNKCARRGQRQPYQGLFQRFLRLIVDMRSEACIVIDEYYNHNDVPEVIMSLRPLVLSLSNPVNNVVPGEGWIQQLSEAAETELNTLDN